MYVPLLRDRKPIGAIGVTRVEAGSFADHHVQLLKTFADQAVIAISNVKLFNEVQDRTKELSQSLDECKPRRIGWYRPKSLPRSGNSPPA